MNIKKFAERYTAAWCGRDAYAVAAFFSPDGSLTINDGAPAQGRAAIAEVAASFMDAFPDLRVAMDGVEEYDGKVIYRWTLTGTNTGPGGTGKPIRISGFEEWQLSDENLIAESRGHFDAADYERQLGS
jgi:steroid delta-isomerase-like uncharacterized protein